MTNDNHRYCSTLLFIQAAAHPRKTQWALLLLPAPQLQAMRCS